MRSLTLLLRCVLCVCVHVPVRGGGLSRSAQQVKVVVVKLNGYFNQNVKNIIFTFQSGQIPPVAPAAVRVRLVACIHTYAPLFYYFTYFMGAARRPR